MPKVSSEYRIKKKEEIVDAAARVLIRKTLYEINMTDLIKEANLSKGGIYLYYKDIDEILIDLMDREFKALNFKERIDEVLIEKYSVKDRLSNLLKLYATYLQESSILAGKMQFELTILLTQNRDRALKIRDRVSIGETGEYFTKSVIELIINNFRESKDSPIKVNDVIEYFQCFIEGVLEVFVLERCYKFSVMNIDLDKMMKMLYLNIEQMMGLK